MKANKINLGLMVIAIILISIALITNPYQPNSKINQERNPQIAPSVSLSKLPLYFIENRGQVNGPVSYYLQGKSAQVYFTSQGLTYRFQQRKKYQLSQKMTPFQPIAFSRNKQEDPNAEALEMESYVVRLRFIGAREVEPGGEGKTPAAISYFKGPQESWKTDIRTYAKVTYRDLWPGIDLVYSGDQQRLKYTFLVHPGADPSQIRLAYDGVQRISTLEDGRLEIDYRQDKLYEEKPYVYQGNQVVESAYSTQGKEYGFSLGPYDHTETLIIDPVTLIYCGYIGGSGNDAGKGITVDSTGSAYVTGTTRSFETSFPVKVGPDLSYNGTFTANCGFSGQCSYGDVFVAKVTPSGTGLVYCGYIGGKGADIGTSIAADMSGAAYVTGLTNSADFPVKGGPGINYNGAYDAFVAKLDPYGTSLIYCGYIGGKQDDYGNGIAIDSTGSAYIAGNTFSDESTFPVKRGPYLTFNNNSQAFIARVDPNGTSLIYCGYIGDLASPGFSNSDWYQQRQGNGVAVDSTGAAYLVGTIYAQLGMGLISDAFVAKVDPSGTNLVYRFYVGGNGREIGYSVAVDSTGSAHITGSTSSSESSFPVRYGPDLTFNGKEYETTDVFIAKINPSGTDLVYCGYIGGTGNDIGTGVVVDAAGAAYVTGYSDSTEGSFPVKIGPSLNNSGGFDTFIAKVNSSGLDLGFCGYIGGNGGDIGHGIARDSTGAIYLIGETNSSQDSFPVIVGPSLAYKGGTYDDAAILPGNTDAFVAKIYSSVISEIIISGNVGTGGVGLSYTYGIARTALADSNGNYLFAVPLNWVGTVTPALTGYTFSPPFRSYTNLTSDQTSQNYTAIKGPAYTISGNVGVAGASLNYNDNGVKSVVSDGSGNYSLTVPINWTGTVTPTLSGYTFTPPSKSYSNVTANQTNQNFTASGPVTISGNSGATGTTLTYVDGVTKTATSDSYGNYSFTVRSGWTGTVTPTLTGFIFSPLSRNYTNITANQTAQNYSASNTIMRLNNNRFEVSVQWTNYNDGSTGQGRCVPVTMDSGYFWFFNPSNIELMVKILDGKAINGYFWVMYGALSDVQYTILVRDTLTGKTKTYSNPARTLSSGSDIVAFCQTGCNSLSTGAIKGNEYAKLASGQWANFIESQKNNRKASITTKPDSIQMSCATGGTGLCLNSNRFRITVNWRNYNDGSTGMGQAVSLTNDSGYFWFFGSNNIELIIKVLDGRAINNHFWIMYGSLSDVEYTITWTDTQTGKSKTYYNPAGRLASGKDLETMP